MSKNRELVFNSSWVQFAQEHNGALRGQLRKMKCPEDDISDVLQDLNLRLVVSERLANIDGVPNPKSYLFAAVTNTYRDRLRQLYRRRDLLPTDGEGESNCDVFWCAEDTDSSVNPEASLLDKEGVSEIDQALGSISVGQREAFLLYSQGLSYDEIANTLGVKLGTVKSRVSRARENLRRSLAYRIKP